MIRVYRYVFAVLPSFSKIGWTVTLKIKNAQTIKDSFEIIFENSQRKAILIEADRRNELYDSFFKNFINNNNIKHYSRNSTKGAVFAERFNHGIRNLPRRPVFEKDDGN